MAKLNFAVHGRGQKGAYLSITDSIDLPGNLSENADLSPEKGQIKNIMGGNETLEEKLMRLEKVAAEQQAVKKVLKNNGPITIQDQIRAIGIEYLLTNYSDKISVADVPNKFLIKENEIELYKTPDGDYVFELATVFG